MQVVRLHAYTLCLMIVVFCAQSYAFGGIEKGLKFRKQNDITVNGVRHGYDPTDAMLVRRETYTPKTQIFSSEELEGEAEDREYFCAICRGPLSYQRKLEAWKCDECQEFYDTKIQDVPVKDINRFKAIPHFDYNITQPMTKMTSIYHLLNA